jgi:hypothetical protein
MTTNSESDEAPKPSSSKKSTPRSRKSKQNSDVVINLDANDPFNFDAQVHNHPEPLGNIKVKL